MNTSVIRPIRVRAPDSQRTGSWQLALAQFREQALMLVVAKAIWVADDVDRLDLVAVFIRKAMKFGSGEDEIAIPAKGGEGVIDMSLFGDVGRASAKPGDNDFFPPIPLPCPFDGIQLCHIRERDLEHSDVNNAVATRDEVALS